MNEIDPATRARLDRYVDPNLFRAEPAYMDCVRGDIRAILIAYDALLTERDALRCKHCSLTGTAHHEGWLVDPAEIAALRAEHARAAPVLAAAEAFISAPSGSTLEAERYLVLSNAVDGWSMARENDG